VRSRDARFDGRFFTAVLTTGVYCRPICPARTPRAENTRFFFSAAAAEAAGFRPCRRCRPETAPGSPAWDGTSRVVDRALRLIDDGALDHASVEDLAARVGVGARQLSRLFAEHVGAAPVAVAQTRRAHFARRLIDDTELPVARVAEAAGFRSLRRFQTVFRSTFGASAGALRSGASRAGNPGAGVALRLPYRAPFDFPALLAFLGPRATPGVENVENGEYRRVVPFDGAHGRIEIAQERSSRVCVTLCGLPPPAIPFVAVRVRRLLDLGAAPEEIGDHLSRDAMLRPLVRRAPGLRIPGSFDPFETAVRAILGQQVSVAGATTIAGRLAARFGAAIRGIDGLVRAFPSPEAVAEGDLAGLGIPRARGETLRSVARATLDGAIRLDPGVDPEEFRERLLEIPGIGPWTSEYLALRILGDPDAFPSGDLVLRQALGKSGAPASARAVERRAETWRPWRAYAAIQIWHAAARRRR
jgi:AraC family transcriptional regulator of adaptative response / DNA-3-methyladenine glycosylase II